MEKENESPLLIALRWWRDNEEEEDDLCKAPFTLEKVESSNIESSKKGVFSLAGGALCMLLPRRPLYTWALNFKEDSSFWLD